MQDRRTNLLRTPIGRKVLFAALYFSEGAPIGYIWWALPTKLRAADVPVEKITALTALLALPWTFKFVWAPLVDTLRGGRWGRRHWIIAAQTGMALALVPLLWMSPADSMQWFTFFLFTHAMLAATQDVAVDALCIASVPDDERGSINGWMQVGMLVGRSIFGGTILYFEGWWGEQVTVPLMIGCILVSATLVRLTAESPVDEQPGDKNMRRIAAAFAGTLLRALSQRSTWLGLTFAATGGAAFEAVGMVAGPLLIDLGMPEPSVHLFRAVPLVVGMAAGALLGGRLSDRLGRKRGTAALAVSLAASVAVLGLLLKIDGLSMYIIQAWLLVIYVLIGAFTACTYSLFMHLTDPRLGATQFSAFMGATNLCEVWAGFTAGRLIGDYGYGNAFLWMALIAGVALLPLWLLPRDKKTQAHLE